MARKSRRSSGKRLFSRVYSPLHHLLSATRNVSNSVFRRSGKIVKEGIGAVDNVGVALAKHANQTVRNVVGSRRRNSRKNRRNTRKNRR